MKFTFINDTLLDINEQIKAENRFLKLLGKGFNTRRAKRQIEREYKKGKFSSLGA